MAFLGKLAADPQPATPASVALKQFDTFLVRRDRHRTRPARPSMGFSVPDGSADTGLRDQVLCAARLLQVCDGARACISLPTADASDDLAPGSRATHLLARRACAAPSPGIRTLHALPPRRTQGDLRLDRVDVRCRAPHQRSARLGTWPMSISSSGTFAFATPSATRQGLSRSDVT
jgi:hypothetical protein